MEPPPQKRGHTSPVASHGHRWVIPSDPHYDRAVVNCTTPDGECGECVPLFEAHYWTCRTNKHQRTRVIFESPVRQKVNWPSQGGPKQHEARELAALEWSWPLLHPHKRVKFQICLLAGMFHGAQSLINPNTIQMSYRTRSPALVAYTPPFASVASTLEIPGARGGFDHDREQTSIAK